jgi:hypothetical protein
LNHADAAYYQLLIGVLYWIVELGHVDITCEVLEMASMMAMPGEGHLDQVFNLFDEWCLSYINTNDNCADMLTKHLAGGQQRKCLTYMVLYHVYDYD